MANVTQDQINKLPDDVKDHLLSNKGDDINLMIVRKYKLTTPQHRVYVELVKRLFVKLLKPSDLPLAISRLFGFDERTSLAMACDIAGARLLVVRSWFLEDIADLIEDWGGDPLKYQPHTEAQVKSLIEERRQREIDLHDEDTDNGEQTTSSVKTPEQIEDVCRQVLSVDLFKYLKLQDNYILSEVNHELINLMMTKGYEIKIQLAGLMFSNQSNLTSQSIVLDGRLVEPTIGHWLEYFVRQKGGGLFDLMSATEFATNADNAKNLDDGERASLIRLLAVYRNLKFFPESQSSTNPADWEIFPLPGQGDANYEEESEDLDETTANYQPYNAKSNNSEDFSADYDTLSADSKSILETPIYTPPVVIKSAPVKPTMQALTEDNSRVREALKLQKMLEQYPQGSLERLAIEEELKKYS